MAVSAVEAAASAAVVRAGAGKVRKAYLNEDGHRRISEAVARAENESAGEIVTVLADRSDGYTDVALAWAAFLTLLVLAALAIFPEFSLDTVARLQGGWVHQWTYREVFSIAAVVAAIVFGLAMLLQRIPALQFFMIPPPIKAKRVHDRALRAFRLGTEQRTTGHTGILIYLSMREHHAEVLADTGIASKVDGAVWAEALEAMLVHVREGDIAEGMCAAVDKVGLVLATHVPRMNDDVNELPDRLIEV